MKSPSLSIPVGQEPFPVTLIPFSPPPFLLIRFPGDDLQEALGVPRELRAELSIKITGDRYSVGFDVSVGISISGDGLFSKLSGVGKALSRHGRGEAFGRFYPEDLGYWVKSLTPNPNSEKRTLVFIEKYSPPSSEGGKVASALKYLIPIFGPRDIIGVLYDKEEGQKRERLLSGDEEEFERVVEHLWIAFASSLKRGRNVRNPERYLYSFSGGSGPGSYVIFSVLSEDQIPDRHSYPDPLRMRKEEFVSSEDEVLDDYLSKYRKSNLLSFIFFKVRFEDFKKAFKKSVEEKKIYSVSGVYVSVVGILSSRTYESQISFKDFLEDKNRKEKQDFIKLSSSLGKLAVLPGIYRKFSYGIYAFSFDHAKDLGNPGFSVYNSSQDWYEDRVINLDKYSDGQREKPPLFSPSSKPSSKGSQSPLLPIVDGFLDKAVEYYNAVTVNYLKPDNFYHLKPLDPYYEYALNLPKKEQQGEYSNDEPHLWSEYLLKEHDGLKFGGENHSVLLRIPRLIVFLVSALSSGVAEPIDVLASYQRILKAGSFLKEFLAEKGISYESIVYKVFREEFRPYLEDALNPHLWRSLGSVLSSHLLERTPIPNIEISPCLEGFPVPVLHIFLYDDLRKAKSPESPLSKYAGYFFLHQYVLWFMQKMREISGISHKSGTFDVSSDSAKISLHFTPYKDGNLRALFVDIGSSGDIKRVVPINVGKVPYFSVAIFDDSENERIFEDSVSYENTVLFSWPYNM